MYNNLNICLCYNFVNYSLIFVHQKITNRLCSNKFYPFEYCDIDDIIDDASRVPICKNGIPISLTKNK